MQIPEIYEFINIIDSLKGKESRVCRAYPIYVISWKLNEEQKKEIYNFWYGALFPSLAGNNVKTGASTSKKFLEQLLQDPNRDSGQIVTVSTSPPNGLKEQLDPALVTRLSDCLSSFSSPEEKEEKKKFTAIPVMMIKDATLVIEGINPYSKQLIYYLGGEKIIGHANILLIDHENQEIELFEPNASYTQDAFIPHVSEYIMQYLGTTGLVKGYSYFDPLDYCPVGPQALSTLGARVETGYCGYWSVYWLASRLINDLGRKQLAENLRKESPEFLRQTIMDLNNGVPGRVIQYPSGKVENRTKGYKLCIL